MNASTLLKTQYRRMLEEAVVLNVQVIFLMSINTSKLGLHWFLVGIPFMSQSQDQPFELYTLTRCLAFSVCRLDITLQKYKIYIQ